MTGQGLGRQQINASEISVEVRAVNNRHLKLQTRTSEGLGSLEPKIEQLVRSNLRRGSIQLNLQLAGYQVLAEYELQTPVIRRYFEQSKEVAESLGIPPAVGMADLLALPGAVLEPRSNNGEVEEDIATAALATVQMALDNLDEMRLAEGASMAQELSRQLSDLLKLTDQIEARSPEVVEEYRTRLKDKLNKALEEVDGSLPEADVVREVLIMADKVDVREEVVRLRSHCDQFANLIASDESQGRKLDFLIQEMFRETNTIGAKASDAQIAQRVVDMKTVIEQMRELVQNVE